MKVKEGSLWRTADDTRFRVIAIVEAGGHTWVHYRLDKCNPSITVCQEWSCYEESFVTRFTPTPE